MKKLIFCVCIFFVCISCSNAFHEYTVVKSISINSISHDDKFYNTLQNAKYKVEIEFSPFNQYFYTDSVYNVGDTLRLINITNVRK